MDELEKLLRYVNAQLEGANREMVRIRERIDMLLLIRIEIDSAIDRKRKHKRQEQVGY